MRNNSCGPADFETTIFEAAFIFKNNLHTVWMFPRVQSELNVRFDRCIFGLLEKYACQSLFSINGNILQSLVNLRTTICSKFYNSESLNEKMYL